MLFFQRHNTKPMIFALRAVQFFSVLVDLLYQVQHTITAIIPNNVGKIKLFLLQSLEKTAKRSKGHEILQPLHKVNCVILVIRMKTNIILKIRYQNQYKKHTRTTLCNKENHTTPF